MASLVQDALDYASAALGTKKKETTVWMDGAFDVMHFGHANAFRQVQISVLYLTFGGLWRFHAIDATRVHQTRSWVVSFSILRVSRGRSVSLGGRVQSWFPHGSKPGLLRARQAFDWVLVPVDF